MSDDPFSPAAENRPAANSLALVFIFVVIFLDTVGFGLIIPVLPALIMDLTGEGVERAVVYGGWLMFLFALMQFFCAPLLGNLSDRYGRRPVLLFSLFAFGIDYLIMGFSTTILWLFIGRTLSGIAGATFTAASAFIADVSPPEKRAQNFGLTGAAFGIGFIVGPAIGGILGGFGPRVPFYAAAGVAFLTMVFGLLVLPESLPRENRRAFEIKRANPAGALIQMLKYPVVIGLLGALILYQIAHDANPAVWTYYTIEKFRWSSDQIGYSLAFVGLAMAISHGYVTRLVIPALGERRTVYLGYPIMALGFAIIAFAPAGWVIMLGITIFCIGSIANPAMRGIMSNTVPGNVQGELQGATTSLMSLTEVIAPLIMTNLFAYFTANSAPIYFPGAAYLAAAILLLGSLAIFTIVIQRASAPNN